MRKVMKISAKIAEMVFIKFIVSIIKYPFRVYRNKEYKNMLLKDTNKEKFSEIYSKNFWSSKESGSGKGSEIIYTKNLRCWLLEALPANGVEKFVDAACGDFNWMKLVIPQLHVEYYGIDIVDSVIEKNIAKYSDEKTKFAVADICNDKLPDCDLIMIRDCLFHLSFSDINDFFANLSLTKYKFLLTTTHILQDNHVNEDIISGHFRHIDLFKSPFHFKANYIVDRFQDSIKGFAQREMILVAKENVPKTLNFS